MSYSVVKIYKNTKILPDKNFMVDDLDTYLTSLGSGNLYTISDFQYIKHSLELEIKIDSDQDNLEFLMAKGWNYCEIKNTGENTRSVYYFIIGKEWKAQSTIKLSLLMDTINTFKYGVDYVLSDKTKVMREHKDRFEHLKYLSDKVFIFNDNFTTSDPRLIGLTSTLTTSGLEISFKIDLTNFLNWDSSMKKEQLTFVVNLTKIYGSIMYHAEVIYWDIMNDYLFVKLLFAGMNTDTFAPIRVFKMILAQDKYMAEYSGFYKRKVDYFNEGLHPVLYKKKETILYQQNITDGWNLFYKGASTPDCYLVPDTSKFTIGDYTSPGIQFNYSDFTDDVFHLIQYGYNTPEGFPAHELQPYQSKISILAGGKSYTPWGDRTFAWDRQHFGYALIKRAGQNYLELYEVLQEHNTFLGTWNLEMTLVATQLPSVEVIGADEVNIYVNTSIPDAYTDANDSWTRTGLTQVRYDILGIEQKDFTDSTLIKVISMPYCPINYDYDPSNTGDGLTLNDSQWSFDNSELEYKLKASSNNHKAFTCIIPAMDSEGNWINNPIYDELIISRAALTKEEIGGKVIAPVNPEILRDPYYESKLLHSSFHQYKFVYDSFSFVFQEEKIDIDNMYEWYFSIDLNTETKLGYMAYNNIKGFVFNFTMTSTINSKMLFTFPFYELKMSEEDYDKVLTIARNNEMTIYNSNYITYLRTAYNYDIKAKERTEKLAGIQFGVDTAVGAISSVGSTIAAGPASAMSWASYFGSTIKGITQLTNTLAQAEESVERKISQMKAQAVSVAGSDDVDLMKEYTTNKAKLVLYECSDRVKYMLFNLFHFTGYATGEMKVPDLTTRYWFNFIQAEILIKENKANIPQSILTNISERFYGGITNIHKRDYTDISGVEKKNQYDFDQQRENWETWLLTEVYS